MIHGYYSEEEASPGEFGRLSGRIRDQPLYGDQDQHPAVGAPQTSWTMHIITTLLAVLIWYVVLRKVIIPELSNEEKEEVRQRREQDKLLRLARLQDSDGQKSTRVRRKANIQLPEPAKLLPRVSSGISKPIEPSLLVCQPVTADTGNPSQSVRNSNNDDAALEEPEECAIPFQSAFLASLENSFWHL